MPPASIPPKASATSSRLAWALAAALAAAGAALPAPGQDKPAPWDAKLYNPVPLPDDVVLPMPCGGSMAFRKVVVPASGALDDYQVTIGAADAARGYAEAPRQVQLAGSFPQGKAERYLLVGKYEVSQLQYQAVLQGECPKPAMPGRLAQGGVTWVDAVTFADRYTLWLRANAAAALPKDGEEAGFVRLPTDTEWEFAARGGAAVTPVDFQERTFPMPEGLGRYVWYGGTQSAAGKPQLTGLLQPNPLGLHDILGNMDEIVLEPFRASKLGRLHGQAGGFTVRGGNYLTPEADIRTADRQEVPHYQGDGPRRAPTTGLRVVVAGPVVSSKARLRDIQAAWSALGSQSSDEPAAKGPDPLAGQAAEDPMEELAIIAKAAESQAMRARLESLQLRIRGNIAERDEQRERSLKALLRLGVFLGQKLRDDGQSLVSLRRIVAQREADKQPEDRIAPLRTRLADEEKVQEETLRYYANTVLGTAADFDADPIRRQRDILAAEFKGLGLAELLPLLEKHVDHLLNYRKSGLVSRNKWLSDYEKP